MPETPSVSSPWGAALARWRRSWAEPGGGGELLRLSWPFILSSSVWTLQITLDRVLLSWQAGGADPVVGATMSAALLFWTPFSLLQATAAYATTFVAQYVGAGRPERVGPAVWQALYFSVPSGIAFMGLWFFADALVGLAGHADELRQLEIVYFRCLCFAALPMLIVASVNSYFAGRGLSRVVLAIEVAGLIVTGLFSYAWIYGVCGFPAIGIAGAGWGMVVGTSTSALLGLWLLFRDKDRATFHVMDGWRFDADLMRRLLSFGLPSGVQVSLDALAFTVFVLLVGNLGKTELEATSITFTLNLIAVMPTLGLSQGVSVLVGQRLGENRPDLAERTTWIGFWVGWAYMAAVALLYIGLPGSLMALFSGTGPTENAAVAALVPTLLRFVAIYCLFDSMNMVFAFALRGAGDTVFVSAASVALAWPLMVAPAWASYAYGWGLYAAWAAATSYVIALAFVFLARFVYGPWRTMRVIENLV